MASGSKKIKGVYVEFRGDNRQLEADLNAARTLVKNVSGDISAALSNAIPEGRLQKGLSSLVTDLAQLQRSSKVGVDAFKNIGFAASDLGARLNLPEKEFAALQARMLQHQAAETQINALRRIGQQAGLTATEIRKLGQAQGVSEAVLDKYYPADAYKGFSALGLNLKQLAPTTDTAMRGQVSGLVSDLSQLQRLNSVGAGGWAKTMSADMTALASSLKLPKDQLQALQSKMLQNQSAEMQAALLKRIGLAAGSTATEIRKLGKEMGVSEAVLDKYYPADAYKGFSALGLNLKQLAPTTDTAMRGQVSGLVSDLSQLQRLNSVGAGGWAKTMSADMTALASSLKLPKDQLQALQSKMLQNQSAEMQAALLKRIGLAAGSTAAEIRKLGQDMGVSEAAMKKLNADGGAGGLSGILSGRGVIGKVGTALGTGYLIQQAIETVAAPVIAVASTGMEFERLEMSLKAITGSKAAAGETLAYLRSESDKAGVSFLDTASAYKSLLAAGQASGMDESVVRDIFSSVVEAGAVVGMTQEQQSRSLLALEQMISKGTVSTEELRKQLGDSLPGAFSTAARAMGVTTAQLSDMLQKGEVISKDFLPKFAKALREDYGGSLEDAAKTGTAAINRLDSSWTQFKANLYDSQPVVDTLNSIRAALDALGGAGPKIKPVDPDAPPKTKQEIWEEESQRIGELREKVKKFKEEESSLFSALPDARTATSAFFGIKFNTAQENVAKAIAKRKAAERELVNAEIAAARNVTDSHPKSEKEQIADEGAAIQLRMDMEEKARSKGEAAANRYRTALESITVELSKANDIYGEGEGALAALERKQTEYTKTLGAANPKVKQHGELVAFAREHMGKTPAEIAKVNGALEDQIDLLNEEIYARQAVAHLYGSDQSDELQMLQARTTAQKDYNKAIADGADEATAGQVKLLALAKAQQDIDDRKEGAARSVAVNYAGPAYNKQRDELIATYELAKNSTTDQVALERAKNEQLSELEEKRLQATGRAQDGMTAALKKYAREAGNDGANMFDLWTSSIKSTEDALVSMATTGEVNVTSMLKSIQAEMTRMLVVKPILSGLTGAVESGALFSGLQGIFASIFHEGGTSGVTPAPTRLVSPEVFAGAPRYHNGLQSGERAAIIRDGEDVLSVVQKARLSNIKASSGANVTMPVTIINNASNTVQASARQVTNAQGGKSLEVQVDELVARKINQPGSASGKALRSSFGASRVMTQRS